MSNPAHPNIESSLLIAARGRVVSSLRPWEYGWCDEGYRRSKGAALQHDAAQSVELNDSAVAAFETAAAALLTDPAIAARYDEDEFWGLLGGLIATLPLDQTDDYLQDEIKARLLHMRAPPDAKVLFPVSHLAIPTGLVTFGPLSLGSAAHVWAALPAAERANLTQALSEGPPVWWWPPLLKQGDAVVLSAYSTPRQLNRAYNEAVEAFDDLVSLALVLEPDLDAAKLYSLRGETHRPGVRGIRLDRHALTKVSHDDARIANELSATIISTGVKGPQASPWWFGEKPFPLEWLLTNSRRRADVAFLLSTTNTVTKRLRLAARWHAKAFWSDERDDAILALGIAFDVLLKEKGNSPGRVHAERYAFLATDVHDRRRRYKRFQGEYYAARSAIAHGGRRSTADGRFVRQMAADTRQTFAQVLAAVQTRSIKNEDEYDSMFDALKWGDERINSGT